MRRASIGTGEGEEGQEEEREQEEEEEVGGGHSPPQKEAGSLRLGFARVDMLGSLKELMEQQVVSQP